MKTMKTLLSFETIFWIGILVYQCHSTGSSDIDVLRPINCDPNRDIIPEGGSCILDGYIAPQDYFSTAYPHGGFCIVMNTSQGIGPGVLGYQFKVRLCTLHTYFGGGIFFNYQDQYNYDVFYTLSEHSPMCILGYVEMGVVHNTTSFECKTGSDSSSNWRMEHGVSMVNGSATVSMSDYPDSIFTRHFEYVPHFEMSPVAGPLHINDRHYHPSFRFGDSSIHTLTCQDSPELCDPCNFAYNVQSLPMYPLPDYRNFLLWYPRALEMVYTSCYFKVMLEQDDNAGINATSKVGSFSYGSQIKVGDFYGERHACISNQAACLQVKAAGSVTDGIEINEDQTLINIKPYNKSGLQDIEINGALQLIYGNSIQESDPLEFSMLLDERVYGPDFGIYCHSSKSVNEAEAVSQNMCLNGDNDGHQPPEGGIVQKGWAIRFH